MSDRHLFWDVVAGRLPPPAADRTLGFRVLEAEEGSGCIRLEFDGRAEFVNPLGHIAGGFVAAMLDATVNLAPATTYAAGEFGPTLELKVSFIRPATVGTLIGIGRTVHRTNSVAFAEGELRDTDGTLVATATATIRIVRREQAEVRRRVEGGAGADLDDTRGVG
jgi:uncharacterized protein (TIGR00369 family)